MSTSPVATRARKLTPGTAQTALPAKATIAAAAAVAPQALAAPVAAAARMPAKPAATAGGDQDWETF
jgi:methyl-accepting chemotaxis protein-1 (serine sensor receptor)